MILRYFCMTNWRILQKWFAFQYVKCDTLTQLLDTGNSIVNAYQGFGKLRLKNTPLMIR